MHCFVSKNHTQEESERAAPTASRVIPVGKRIKIEVKLIEVVRRWRGFDHLRGVPLRPQLGDAVVLLAVLSVLGGDRADQGVGGVAVAEQGADGEQDLRDGEGRRPLVLEDVQADHPLRVDVAVVDPGPELHLWRLERVLWG